MASKEPPLAGGQHFGTQKLSHFLFRTLDGIADLVSKPPMKAPKSVAHVMSTPELILLLLQEFDNSEDFNHAALVCKIWTPLALDTKWKIIEVRLTRLLGTLGRHAKMVGKEWDDVS